MFFSEICRLPDLLQEGGDRGGRVCRFGIHAPNHGRAQERRVCVLSGTSHGTLPLRWQTNLSEGARQKAAHAAHAMGAHAAPMAGIGGESSRASLVTGPTPRRKSSDGLKRPGTHTSPRRGPSFSTFAGSGDHGHLEDSDLQRHYASKMWPTQLRSIRSQVTKSALDVKCEEYQSLSDEEKLNLRDYKVVEWFRRSNWLCARSWLSGN
jgi:hypothetical protein